MLKGCDQVTLRELYLLNDEYSPDDIVVIRFFYYYNYVQFPCKFRDIPSILENRRVISFSDSEVVLENYLNEDLNFKYPVIERKFLRCP